MSSPLNLADVYRARAAIGPWVRRTPLVRSEALSRRLGRSVHLKLETLQEAGSFKLRGAANRLLAVADSLIVRSVWRAAIAEVLVRMLDILVVPLNEILVGTYRTATYRLRRFGIMPTRFLQTSRGIPNPSCEAKTRSQSLPTP